MASPRENRITEPNPNPNSATAASLPSSQSNLKITVENVSIVKPDGPESSRNRRAFFLSNFDQSLTFPVHTMHVFAANHEYPFSRAVDALRKALQKLLVESYDFLAGRLVLNKQEQRLEIDCNGQGVVFAVARSDLSLQDLGRIVGPQEAFQPLVPCEHEQQPLNQQPLAVFQMTKMKCGGVVLGMATNHAALDGASIVLFLQNLAAVGGGVFKEPWNDRRLLQARQPPRTEYPHVEVVPPPWPSAPATATGQAPTSGTVALSGDAVAALLSTAAAGGAHQCSSFEAVMAHLWIRRTAALRLPAGAQSWMLFVVDVSRHVRPPLSPEFAGNAVFPGYACAPAGDIAPCPVEEDEAARLAKCARMIREGIERVRDDGYVRSGIDWGELNHGWAPMCAHDGGSVMVTSWWRLGMHAVGYPWGTPLYAGPAVHKIPHVAFLLPNRDDPRGVYVHLGLPASCMPSFCSLFASIPRSKL